LAGALNLDSLIKRAAATKLVFGKSEFTSPYHVYIKRALELGMNDIQMKEIEDISWDDYPDIKKEYFKEYNW